MLRQRHNRFTAGFVNPKDILMAVLSWKLMLKRTHYLKDVLDLFKVNLYWEKFLFACQPIVFNRFTNHAYVVRFILS